MGNVGTTVTNFSNRTGTSIKGKEENEPQYFVVPKVEQKAKRKKPEKRVKTPTQSIQDEFSSCEETASEEEIEEEEISFGKKKVSRKKKKSKEDEDVLYKESRNRFLQIPMKLKSLKNIDEVEKMINAVSKKVKDIMKVYHRYRENKKVNRGVVALEKNVYLLGKDVASIDNFFQACEENINNDKNVKQLIKKKRFKYLKSSFYICRSQIMEFFASFESGLEELYITIRDKTDLDGERRDDHAVQIQAQLQRKKQYQLQHQQKHEMMIEREIERLKNEELKELIMNMNIIDEMMEDIKKLVDHGGETIDLVEDRVQRSVKDAKIACKHIKDAENTRPRSQFEKLLGVYNNVKRAYKVGSFAGNVVAKLT